ncbi:sodium/solute symporter [Exilibacterium tricleocarpae]|uniref:Sodium/solute symporter n=1 Tax=Exilibacterium tricleocarpae TaxID=2591008 RepID=A0A545STE6_9GAMM|nr:sodium:solute symporter [Exilibacterium tricleocarpae]TQV68229.1 sodium/solute symporter [Exilibacterium tricleocarpae]
MDDVGLSRLDSIIILIYIVGIIWYGIRKGKQSNSEDYFLGGRSMTWPIVGISLFAANIGSNTLIGLSSSAFQGNVAVYNYEWMAAVILVFFAIFFLPFYLRSKVYTMPEFLERRFDSRCRYLFSIIMIVGNIIIDMASGLYAGNLILKIIFPEIDTWIIISLLALSAAAYTIPGGLSSAVHTEVLQALLLVAGSCLLTWFCFREVGGWEGMTSGLDALFASGQTRLPADEVLSLVKPADHPQMPWTGLLLGVPLLGFYFWVNNQFIVQRVLSAKDLNHGRWGALFAGLLKLPVLFIMVIPGAVATVLYTDLDISFLGYQIPAATGGQTLCTSLHDCPNMTYPVLIYKLLPVGILGLVVAGILAAMASSISATLNSASTLITMDLVTKLRPDIGGKKLVRVGQINTLVLVILAAAWAPQIERFSSLWEYLQSVLAYISPPIAAAFLVGLFYKRANARGAFASLLLGYGISIAFLVVKTAGWAPAITNIHFLLQVPALLVICAAANIVISATAPAPAAEVVEHYTWKPALYHAETRELAALPWYQNYRVLSIGLLLVTAGIVVTFW